MTNVLDYQRDYRRPDISEQESDRTDLDLLHNISVSLIGENDRVQLYGKIVDAAVSITGSQFGTMQLLCPTGDPSGHGGELQLLSSHGLTPEDIGFWQWVNPAAYSSCTMALKLRQRAVIADFESGTTSPAPKTWPHSGVPASGPRRQRLCCRAAAVCSA